MNFESICNLNTDGLMTKQWELAAEDFFIKGTGKRCRIARGRSRSEYKFQLVGWVCEIYCMA